MLRLVGAWGELMATGTCTHCTRVMSHADEMDARRYFINRSVDMQRLDQGIESCTKLDTQWAGIRNPRKKEIECSPNIMNVCQ